MSEIVEPKVNSIDTEMIKLETFPEETKSLLEEVDNKNSTEKEEQIIIKTFLNLFESFITKEENNLHKYSVKLTPDIQKYFLLLCKETPDLFGSLEESLKKIIQDNLINTKDIPEILIVVSKVYQVINEKKPILDLNPYELLKTLLQLAFIVYIDNNKVENPQLLDDLLKIIEASINLIKLVPFLPKKINCFSFLKC